jgi:hypothetical protein
MVVFETYRAAISRLACVVAVVAAASASTSVLNV